MSWLWIAGALWTIFLVACGVSLVALFVAVLNEESKRQYARMRRRHAEEMQRIATEHEQRMAEWRRYRDRTNPWIYRGIGRGPTATEAERILRQYEQQGFVVYRDGEGREYNLTPNDWVETGSNRREVRQRAEALLHSHLTPSQRTDLANTGGFFVNIIHHGRPRRFYIPGGRLFTIKEYDVRDNSMVARYCIQPLNPNIPEADVMLAQKLLLETDPKTFFATANKFTA